MTDEEYNNLMNSIYELTQKCNTLQEDNKKLKEQVKEIRNMLQMDGDWDEHVKYDCQGDVII